MTKVLKTLAVWYENGSFISYMWNTSLDVYFYSVKKSSGITLDFNSKRAAFNFARS